MKKKQKNKCEYESEEPKIRPQYGDLYIGTIKELLKSFKYERRRKKNFICALKLKIGKKK